ncbi:MAG: glycosyltransferase family 87 protein [Patescibacteria group bacterium]|jgi:hypothetical protein
MNRFLLPLAAVSGGSFFIFSILAPAEYLIKLSTMDWLVFLPAAVILVAWLLWETRERRMPSASTHTHSRLLFVLMLILAIPVMAVFQQTWLRIAAGDPAAGTHDGAVQTEAALTFLLDGENPYSANYQETPFGRHGDFFSQGALPNPAWEHYVYPPGYLIASLPFAAYARTMHIFYDQRIAQLFFFAAALGILSYGVRKANRARAWILFGLNPVFLWFYISGYNDIAVVAALTGAAVFWNQKRIVLAFFLLGIAVTVKQSAVLFVPAFLIALFFFHRRFLCKALAAFLISPLLLYGSFLFINAGALIDDLLRFPSAGGLAGYPISGVGISRVLLEMGIIAGDRDVYPFWLLQAAVALPLFVAMIFVIRKHSSAWMLVSLSTVFTAFIWVMARYFNDSHLAFLLQMVIVGYILYYEKESVQSHA